MDEGNPESRRGIFDSLRALVDRVVAILHNRAQLFTTELEEEVSRLVGVLLWGIVAVFAVMTGATFAGFAIVLFIPPAWRPWAAAGLAFVFLLVAALGWISIRKIMRAKPRPFDASLRELEKDREHLRGGK